MLIFSQPGKLGGFSTIPFPGVTTPGHPIPIPSILYFDLALSSLIPEIMFPITFFGPPSACVRTEIFFRILPLLVTIPSLMVIASPD